MADRDARPDGDDDADPDADTADADLDPDPLSLEAGVARVHEHLRATEELPLQTSANRWLGEATAVVADVDGADLPAETVRERLEHVRHLLSNVEETGHAAADEHVAAARALVEALLE